MKGRTVIKRRGPTRTRDLPRRNFTNRTLRGKLQFVRWGVEAFNDSMDHLSRVEELNHEGWTQCAITEWASLMLGHLVRNNSSVNLKISCSLKGRISKTLIGGKKKIDGLSWNWRDKASANWFRQEIKGRGELQRKAISGKEGRNYWKVRKLKSRGSNLHMRWVN